MSIWTMPCPGCGVKASGSADILVPARCIGPGNPHRKEFHLSCRECGRRYFLSEACYCDAGDEQPETGEVDE